MANNDLTAKIKIDGDASGAVKAVGAAEKSLQGLGDASKGAGATAKNVDGIGEAAQRAAQKADPANKSIKEGIASIGTQLTEVKALYAAWLGAQAAGNAIAGVATTADSYKNLAARIKLVTGEGAAFKSAFEGVQEVALRTNSSLEATGTLFARLADAGKNIGVGQVEALRLTETVNQAIQLSGASAQASQASITQLIQGLQSGVLRGDEFNSVMEQSPRLAKALADGLGVTTGELRKMAEAGQLSSDTVIKSLQGQSAVIEREFGTLPATIGRAVTDLQTQWQRWIGTLDESTGASSAAAGAIEALAKNFDFVASSLINAGQAYLGWKAYNMAAEFLSVKAAVTASAAAKAADTAATVANTAATAANTTAQLANNAAKSGAVPAAAGAAAGAGRLAAAIGGIKVAALAFLVTNLKDVGTWMGEAAAKAMGYGKVIEDNERKMRAEESAARAVSAANAELAQKKQIAADKALGLSERAKKLVADFDELKKSGETTAEALGKIGKDLDLSNIKGIAEAGAALDALAVRGKASAAEVQATWQEALKGQDLMVFEVNARAAFDGSEQGARRLAGAIDAQLGEALRRTGLDAGELGAGINKATAMAINDFDILNGRVAELKGRGVDAGIALAASLDQAEKSVTTVAAAQAVLDRWKELGEAGLVTGDRLAEGLEKARLKLDELTPGVTSVNEAFNLLGMKSPEELKKTAVAAEQAFNKIKAGGDFSQAGLARVNEAFKRMAEASIAANGGVASDTIRVQAEMRGLQIVTDAAGKSIVKSMGEGADATGAVGDAAAKASGDFDKMAQSASAAADAAAQAGDATSGLSSAGVRGPAVPRSGIGDLLGEAYKRGATVEEGRIMKQYLDELFTAKLATLKFNNNDNDYALKIKQITNQAIDEARAIAQKQLAAGNGDTKPPTFQEAAGYELAKLDFSKRALPDAIPDIQAAYRRAGNTTLDGIKSVVRVDLRTDGNKKSSVNVASPADATALISTLKELQGRTA